MSKPQFDIVVLTIDKPVFRGTATMVVAPGVEGDLGILANHFPIMATLRSGTISIYGDGPTPEHTFSILDGYIEMVNNQCTAMIQLENS